MQLPLKAQRFCDVATQNPAALGLDEGILESIREGAEDVLVGNAAVMVARSTYRAAVLERLERETVCVDALAAAANRVYANPSATPDMIAALGRSPRSASRVPIKPIAPATLVAAILPTSEIRLKWSRSGNAEEVIFVVECQQASGAWSHVESTTRTSLKLRGFAPGVTTSFRVRATKNGQSTAPSLLATVYPAPGPSLRLAA